LPWDESRPEITATAKWFWNAAFLGGDMRSVVAFASAVIVAVASAACGNSQQGGNADLFAPSDASAATQAKGGGGGGGKPPGGGTTGGSGTLTLVMVTDLNGDGLPNHDDVITWNLQQTVTTQPYIDTTCYQNGNPIMSASTGLFDGYPWPWTNQLRLASGLWQNAPASCTSRARAGSTTIATLTFNVGA
jgi:hypothetical protein